MIKFSGIAAAGALVAALALASCGRGNATTEGPPPPQVSVANPLVRQTVDWDDYVGRFEASQQVDVRARVGGYVQAIHFRDGQMVKKGQLLFTLDPRPAQAALGGARAQLAFAKSDFARAKTLVEGGAISREELETKQAALGQAESAANTAQLNVEFTRITAPISGMVSYHRVDAGNLVAGGSSSGDILTTIVAATPIHFTFDASEALLLKYQRQSRAGTRAAVKVRLQDETDYRWNGVLDFADNAIDAQSGAVRLRAVVRNPQGFIRPGMFGHARVVGSGAYNAMLVPDVAIATDGPRKILYVVSAAGDVTARPVEIGPLSGSLRVVRTGINANDLVIVNGVQRARPGQKVQAKKVLIKDSGAADAVTAPSAPAAAYATSAADAAPQR